MMNKTVLYLINGLGVEKKDSFPIYNSRLMPNFDKLLNSNFFTTLETESSNYKEAYQVFSTGSSKQPEYSFLENLLYTEEINNNNNFNQFKNFISNNSNLHIFVALDNNIIDQLSDFLKHLKINHDKEVFIHIILKENDIESYKKLGSSYNYLRFKIQSNVKVGAILGKDILFNSDRKSDLLAFAKLLFKGFGEKWNEPLKKFESFKMNKKRPSEINAFYVNNINMKENDTILFFDYEDNNYDELINILKTPISFVSNGMNLERLSFVSLFPLKTSLNIQSMFGHVVSPYSVSKALIDNKLNALIIADNLNMNTINYMVNGLSFNQTNNVKYMTVLEKDLNNFNALNTVINDPNYNLIIINTRIDNLNTAEEIKGMLSYLDQNIKMVSEICTEHTLIISSLFGINKTVTNEGKNVDINFKGKVPMIYINKKISKANYILSSGTIYDLLTTSIKSIDSSINCRSLLRKKGFMDKLLKK